MHVSQKLRAFGTTIFSEMTRLAGEHDAVNLSQGFPDFEGPGTVVDAVIGALREGHNQYARSMGHPELVEAIADLQASCWGLDYDPMREIVITSGATEAIHSALLGLLDPGDEVVLFEPFYDSYPASVAMAGAVPRFYTLRFPDFAVDEERLRAAVTDRTRLVILNTPHNPTGKVFSTEELSAIARVCQERDLLVLSDEVYEHLTYDGATHVSIASLPGMRDRTLRVSSAGKSYSFTGWKVGWAMGPDSMIQAIQAAHQFVTFATATPLQVGLARAIRGLGPAYYDTLRASYAERRDVLCATLSDVGLAPARPAGTYFVLADFARVFDGDDRAFARHLIERHRVAAIPPSAFYRAEPDQGRRLIRFAFCKRLETLQTAQARLAGLVAEPA